MHDPKKNDLLLLGAQKEPSAKKVAFDVKEEILISFLLN